MQVGEDIAVAIEKGKTLVVRLQAVGDTDEEGQVRVFFELNGQPRMIKVPNRAAAASRSVRREADETNDKHVADPMPGAVVMVSVRPGQGGQNRRRPPNHRGHEDGNVHSCRARRTHRRSYRESRRAGKLKRSYHHF